MLYALCRYKPNGASDSRPIAANATPATMRNAGLSLVNPPYQPMPISTASGGNSEESIHIGVIGRSTARNTACTTKSAPAATAAVRNADAWRGSSSNPVAATSRHAQYKNHTPSTVAGPQPAAEGGHLLQVGQFFGVGLAQLGAIENDPDLAGGGALKGGQGLLA